MVIYYEIQLIKLDFIMMVETAQELFPMKIEKSAKWMISG